MPTKVKVKITKQQAAKIKRLYSKNAPLAEISRQTGLSCYFVRKALLDMELIAPGQNLPGGRPFNPMPKKELKSLLREYETPRGVAEYLKRDITTVKRHLNHHGIKWKRKSNG